ncbi:MAG: DUF3298 and DUF4163 domain-containing protein [Epulopiscium sp.]|nr:DUF3298 and DUF4163 domain-containing protein [Candidatus Epulonipiscium sp.]
MKSKKVIALGLASCVLLSQPLYAAQPLKGNTKPRGPMKGKPAVVAVQKDQVKEVRFTTKKITSTEDGLVLDICIPVIEGFTDIKFQKKLNDTIEKQIMKDKKDMEQEVKKYLHDAKKQDLKISPYKLQVDYDIKSSGDILSFTITTGVSYGNNSMERVDSYNIDEKGNQLLQLKDLFKEGSDYKKIIVAEIEKQIKAQEDNKVVYFKGNKGYKNISATQAFYIQGDSVVITFPKYSIAPGFMGTPEFKIPFSMLKDLLK